MGGTWRRWWGCGSCPCPWGSQPPVDLAGLPLPPAAAVRPLPGRRGRHLCWIAASQPDFYEIVSYKNQILICKELSIGDLFFCILWYSGISFLRAFKMFRVTSDRLCKILFMISDNALPRVYVGLEGGWELGGGHHAVGRLFVALADPLNAFVLFLLFFFLLLLHVDPVPD